MKIYIVVNGDVSDGAENAGVHQVENYAIEQANELMSVGEWSEAQQFDTGYCSCITWFRNDDFVCIETWELEY